MCKYGTIATKAQLIADWRALYGEGVSGHSSRRSGALQHICNWWSITQVAFLGRWKSNVILEYAKEALQTIALKCRQQSVWHPLRHDPQRGRPDQPNIDPAECGRRRVGTERSSRKVRHELRSFVKGTKVETNRLDSAVRALEAKYNDCTKYLPKWVKSTRTQVIHHNSKVFLCSPAAMWKTLCGWNYDASEYELHEGEPTGEICKKCAASAQMQ